MRTTRAAVVHYAFVVCCKLSLRQAGLRRSSIGAIHAIFVIVRGLSVAQLSVGRSARTWSSVHCYEKCDAGASIGAGVSRRRGVNLGNAVGAALGLAALFAASSFAFAVAKYSGAAYLIYLGIKTLRSSHAAPVNVEMSRCTSLPRVFLDGFTVALLNPKTVLFFAAYLPQFLPMSKAPMSQTLELGFIFIHIAATTDCAYALAAGSLKPWLGKEQRLSYFGHKLAGCVYIGLGLLTAFTSQRVKNYSR